MYPKLQAKPKPNANGSTSIKVTEANVLFDPGVRAGRGTRTRVLSVMICACNPLEPQRWQNDCKLRLISNNVGNFLVSAT